MKTIKEIRTKIQDTLILYDQENNPADKEYLDVVQHVLYWVLDEGDDPLDVYTEK